MKSTLKLSFTIAEIFGVDHSLVATMAANLYVSKVMRFAVFSSSSIAEYTFKTAVYNRSECTFRYHLLLQMLRPQ